MEAIEKFTHNGLTISIYHDDQMESPRTAWDHLSIFACWHRRANLGDRQIQGMTEEEIREDIGEDLLALLPIYLYDHSGMTIQTTPFGCRWDSGQVGWAYVTKQSAEAMGCVGEDWPTEKLEEAIRGEVAEYDAFLWGACYGYVIEDSSGKELDSCWGFIGDMDNVRDEARGTAKHIPNHACTTAASLIETCCL